MASQILTWTSLSLITVYATYIIGPRYETIVFAGYLKHAFTCTNAINDPAQIIDRHASTEIECDVLFDLLIRDASLPSTYKPNKTWLSFLPQRHTHPVRAGSVTVNERSLHCLAFTGTDPPNRVPENVNVHLNSFHCQQSVSCDEREQSHRNVALELATGFEWVKRTLWYFRTHGMNGSFQKGRCPVNRQSSAVKTNGSKRHTFQLPKPGGGTNALVKVDSKEEEEEGFIPLFACFCGKYNVHNPCDGPKQHWQSLRALLRSTHLDTHVVSGYITLDQLVRIRAVKTNETHPHQVQVHGWRQCCVIAYENLIDRQDELNPYINDPLLADVEDPSTVVPLHIHQAAPQYPAPPQIPLSFTSQGTIDMGPRGEDPARRPPSVSSTASQNGTLGMQAIPAARFSAIAQDYYTGLDPSLSNQNHPGLHFQTTPGADTRYVPQSAHTDPPRDTNFHRMPAEDTLLQSRRLQNVTNYDMPEYSLPASSGSNFETPHSEPRGLYHQPLSPFGSPRARPALLAPQRITRAQEHTSSLFPVGPSQPQEWMSDPGFTDGDTYPYGAMNATGSLCSPVTPGTQYSHVDNDAPYSDMPWISPSHSDQRVSEGQNDDLLLSTGAAVVPERPAQEPNAQDADIELFIDINWDAQGDDMYRGLRGESQSALDVVEQRFAHSENGKGKERDESHRQPGRHN